MFGFSLNLLQDLLAVVWYIVFLDEFRHRFHLGVADEATLDALGFALAQGGIEHVATAHQLFRALGIQDDPGLHGGGHGKGNPAGDVGLHEACDHIGRGTLGGDDQVHPGGAAHLGNPADGLLHLLSRHQHQVGQLVNDYHNLGQGIPLPGALPQCD